MNEDLLKVLMRVVPPVLLVGGGLWLYASHDMTSRLHDFRGELREQSALRDGSMPTEAMVRARADELANEHHVAIDDVGVAVDENAPPSDSVAAATGMLAPLGVNVHYTGYTVSGNAHVSKWFFSRTEPIDVSFSIRREVTARTAPGTREPTARDLNPE